jgi:isoleucyl-tRNA synthetase
LFSHFPADSNFFFFFAVYRLAIEFCVTDLSNFYFLIVKDRLYCNKPASVQRRSAQTVLVQVAKVLNTTIAPICINLSEEVFQHLPGRPQMIESVFQAGWVAEHENWRNEALAKEIELLRELRDEVNRRAEALRNDKFVPAPRSSSSCSCCSPPRMRAINRIVRSSAEVEVEVFGVDETLAARIADCGADFFGTASVQCLPVAQTPSDATPAERTGPKVAIRVKPTTHGKCPRCWRFIVAAAPAESLCSRCEEAVQQPN